MLETSSAVQVSTNHVRDLFELSGKGRARGEGFGYTVATTLRREEPLIPKRTLAFGWAGAAGTMSRPTPARELAGVIMVQQPTKDFASDISKVIRDAFLDE